MRSSPYRAGLAGRHPKRLPMPPALLACYGPVWLSPPGKLLTQEPVFRTPPLSERDLILGDTAHVVGKPHEVHLVGATFLRRVVSPPQQRFEAVQGEVRGDGGERTALRRPLLRRVEDVFVHVSGLQPFVQHGFVHGDVGHEPVMADPVERAPIFLPHSMTHSLMR